MLEAHVPVGHDAEQVHVRVDDRYAGDVVTAADGVGLPMVASGEMVIGSSTIPASERLTTSTWRAWSSIDMFR